MPPRERERDAKKDGKREAKSRKRTHGEYAAFYYNAEAGLPAELEKRLRINENALRWLTVVENPSGIPPAPTAAAPEGVSVIDEIEEKAKKEGDE